METPGSYTFFCAVETLGASLLLSKTPTITSKAFFLILSIILANAPKCLGYFPPPPFVVFFFCATMVFIC